MNSGRDNFISSSPSKMFDQYIDQAFENNGGTSSNNTSNTMSNLQINTPTGFTPFFDRQSNSITFHKSPQQSKQIQQQLLYQQRQMQQHPPQQSSQQQIPNFGPPQSRGQFQYLNQSYISYEPGTHPILASSPQRPSDIFNYPELLQSTTTPVAERSFKVSDFFVDTPTLNQYDLDALLGEASKENPNGINDYNSINVNGTNIANIGFLSNFGTPIEKLNKFFKTPLHEYSGSRMRNGSTTTSNGNSIKRSLNFANVATTPSKDRFTTPLKKTADQSSPSTIIIGSAAKAEAATRLQMSPTPVAKSSVKAPICQLVKSSSSLEPVIGIFQDQNKLPPSFGSVALKKTNKSHDLSEEDQLLPRQLSSSSSAPTSSQMSQQQSQFDSFSKKRGNEDMASGMSKFQIVFADVKNLKNSNKSKKRKTMSRSSTTTSVMKKKQQQQPTNQHVLQPTRQQKQETQFLLLRESEDLKNGKSLVRYATDPSFSHSSSSNVSALADITNSSRNNIKPNYDTTFEDNFKPNKLNLSPIKLEELNYTTSHNGTN